MQKPLGRGEFAKYHALGNDYIVVDSRRLGVRLTPPRIRSLCDRQCGVGSDGILALSGTRAECFALRIFNPDGSEAEKSGNGIRIFARFLHDFGYTRKNALCIQTRGGAVHAQLSLGRDRGEQIQVDMGRATFDSAEIPVRGRRREVIREPLQVGPRTFRVTCVSIGNPHCVIFVPRLRVEELRRFGPLIECHWRFPNRINVQLAHVQSRRLIDALIWERGAGETRASGSSSCAVAAAAFRNGVADRTVEVRMPGGMLAIEIDEGFQIRMTGPATPVYRGTILRLAG